MKTRNSITMHNINLFNRIFITVDKLPIRDKVKDIIIDWIFDKLMKKPVKINLSKTI